MIIGASNTERITRVTVYVGGPHCQNLIAFVNQVLPTLGFVLAIESENLGSDVDMSEGVFIPSPLQSQDG